MSAHGHSDDGHDFAHPMPVPMLLAVFFALVVLTIITVAAAKVDFGSSTINLVIALLIASIKASLVGLFFMHLKYEGSAVWTFVLVSLVSRSARFFLVAAFIWKFGAPVKHFIDRYFNLLTILFFVLLIGGFLVVKFFF